MATYASTLIVKGKLDGTESDFIKKLNLSLRRRNTDNHKIGRENITYNDALSSMESGEVYVAYHEAFSVVVSINLVQDFMFNGLLYHRVKSLFPSGEMFLLFNNTTSNLGGFVYWKDGVIIRRKCVMRGKIELNDGEALDSGELLAEEKAYYEEKGMELTAIKNSSHYLNGHFDFEIGIDFLEKQFFKTNPISIFDDLVLNPDFGSSISAAYLDKVNKKVEINEIDELVLNEIQPLVKAHQFKRFKTSKKSTQINRAYKKVIAKNVFITISYEIRQMFGRYGCDIIIGFFDEQLLNQFPTEIYLSNRSEETGIPIFSERSGILLATAEHPGGTIIDWEHFQQYVIAVPKQIEQIETALNLILNKQDFFKDKTFFQDRLNQLKDKYVNGHGVIMVNLKELNFFMFHLLLHVDNGSQVEQLKDFFALDLKFMESHKEMFLNNLKLLKKD